MNETVRSGSSNDCDSIKQKINNRGKKQHTKYLHKFEYFNKTKPNEKKIGCFCKFFFVNIMECVTYEN